MRHIIRTKFTVLSYQIRRPLADDDYSSTSDSDENPEWEEWLNKAEALVVELEHEARKEKGSDDDSNNQIG
jgi:hypothetical protein